jgi:uncharacterized repeat protein (TIGR01451 family)
VSSSPAWRIRVYKSLGVSLFVFAVACSDDQGGVTQPPAGELPFGVIAGRVTETSILGGRPVPGATITTQPATSTVLTDSTGKYVIADAPTGSYVVAAKRGGYLDSSLSVNVTAGDTARASFALLRPGGGPFATGSVAGLVARRDGPPVPQGTRVEVFPRDPGCEGGTALAAVVTDAAGRYLVDGLPQGDYMACVRATIEGREFAGRSHFAVLPGQDSAADISVEPLPAQLPGPGPSAEGFGAATVSLGDIFRYTFTVIADGEGSATNVFIADTLPLLDNSAGPPAPGDRDGNQAMRYVTDRPTFDPDAIRYYLDLDDDEGGTATDVCFRAPVPGFPAAFTTARSTALCGGIFQEFPTIAAARAAAEQASAAGDQVVVVEYFDADILDRTPVAGDVEAEDAFEITVQAIHSVNEFRLASGAIPGPQDENGQWCNIITAISAENDFVIRKACTRVVEGLLEVRKTASDALVTAGSQTEFRVQIGNAGSASLRDLVVSDSLDAGFLNPPTGDPGLVMAEDLCTGCAISFNADSTVLRIAVPAVPLTDLDGDGLLDDAEGFDVVNLVVRTPLAGGTFCNRVTAADGAGRSDADLACVVTQVEIELDVLNEDGLRSPAGDFVDAESFQPGDSVVYRTRVTNRSAVAATNVRVLWQVAPDTGSLRFAHVLLAEPAGIACSASSNTCSATLPVLAPGASVALDFLAVAERPGVDVNRITLRADQLTLPVVNEEPTAIGG